MYLNNHLLHTKSLMVDHEILVTALSLKIDFPILDLT